MQNTIWSRRDCSVFFRVSEPLGGLSNMAGGFPIWVNARHYRSSEHLYQCCKYPDNKTIQEEVFGQSSGIYAARVARSAERQEYVRPDWPEVHVEVMRWCLRMKLKWNYESFSQLLLSTIDMPIVEQAHKPYWGAVPAKDNPDVLVGQNILGNLLTELRDELISKIDRPEEYTLRTVMPPDVPDLLLFGLPAGRA